MRKFTPNLPEFHRENSLFDNNSPVYYTIKGNKWKKPAYFFHGGSCAPTEKTSIIFRNKRRLLFGSLTH